MAAITVPSMRRSSVSKMAASGPIRRSIARSEDDLTARMPRPEEVAALELPPGVPVFRVLRTVYDAEDQPVEVQDTVADADAHQFRYEVDMR